MSASSEPHKRTSPNVYGRYGKNYEFWGWSYVRRTMRVLVLLPILLLYAACRAQSEAAAAYETTANYYGVVR
jgi:hypothetical protein